MQNGEYVVSSRQIPLFSKLVWPKTHILTYMAFVVYNIWYKYFEIYLRIRFSILKLSLTGL